MANQQRPGKDHLLLKTNKKQYIKNLKKRSDFNFEKLYNNICEYNIIYNFVIVIVSAATKTFVVFLLISLIELRL
jgi:hypothetical protein